MAKVGRPAVKDKVVSFVIYARQSTLDAIKNEERRLKLTRSKMTRRILEQYFQEETE